MREQPISVAGVCNTGVVAGGRADPHAAPDLLIEVPHGATRLLHYESLRGVLKGDYPDDLIKFFYVNTDVGAPETAVAIARGLLKSQPELKIRILRSLVPRTFIDCNRTPGATNGNPKVTPRVPDYVTDPADIDTITAYHQSYVAQAERAYAEVCGEGGQALILHTYAPRTVDLSNINGNIVEQLAEAWKPNNRRKWSKRPDVDLITMPPDGESLASPDLVDEVRRRYRSIKIDVAENATYNLHPDTLGWRWSREYPRRVLCVELNRQRLVRKWTP
ncbi:MAG: hypothetical protein GTN89_06155, partial [Acidobacteria bacterium]|nr:hypothetical protein [Acidobacteriota bacterium]NIM61633.1 hypothetical protein [Acidobacteriota bacterium]NIO58897.1 hypothetical protein [Acidobacteriota bacterium]NIQ29948.1 hypothetical protein [Acidobacteriota bacterium]NIQ87441.1 hypothetical protein [Acidobacteriota bacterium]